MKFKTKNNLKWALTIISLILSVIAIVALCVSLGNMSKTKTLSNSDYSIGTINEQGKVADSKQSAYTKKAYKTEDMSIDIDEENATITYKIAFYDKDGKFVSMTEALSEDFDTTNTPATATEFRVVITPNQVDGEAVTLSVFNMGKYTGQLTIVVNK